MTDSLRPANRPLVIDVRTPITFDPEAFSHGPVVVVEPLYGAVAAALALESGWGSVELSHEVVGAAPIPLVSFEGAPPAEHREGQCRLRANDLVSSIPALDGGDQAPLLLGTPTLARPLGARLATSASGRITFVAADSEASAHDDELAFETACADSQWACGMLIRVLLEELDQRDATLTDAAGVTVSLAQGAEDVAAQLGTGARWRRHLARGGAEDDLRVASAVDSIGVVPHISMEGGSLVARPWIDG